MTWSPETQRQIDKTNAMGEALLRRVNGEGCKWEHDEHHDAWDTKCGEKFVFIEGGPVDNRMKFCPYCGNEIT